MATNPPKHPGNYYDKDSQASRRSIQDERAKMSQADAQKALGRPGENTGDYSGPESLLGSGNIKTLPHSEVERWGTDAEKDDFNKQAELRAQAKKEHPELGGGGEDKKGLGGKVRNLLVRRQKAIIATALGSSLIGVIIAGFFALLPLKLESFMKNFEQKFGQKVEDVTERRVGQIVTYYLVKRALGAEFANCDTTPGGSGKLCDPIINKGGLLGDLYKNMQVKKFENTLAEKQGIRFRVYEGSNGLRRLAVTTPAGVIDDTIQGDLDGSTGRFDPSRDLFGSNREARLAFKNAVNKELPWYRVMKRRHMRALLRDKYGVKQWRVFEKTRDNVDDRVAAAKKKFKTVRVNNVTLPAFEKMGLYIKCVVDGCTKNELDGDADPFRVEENAQSSSDSDCRTAGARSPNCRGGLDPESNGTEEDTRERQQAREDARRAAESAGDGPELPELDDNASADEIRKVIQKSTLRKLASIGFTGIGIAEVISQIDKAISEDYITDVTESRNKLQFVRAYQIYQTTADEWKNGDMTGEEVNAFMEPLNKMETSRLYAYDYDLSIPTSNKTCSDGKVLPPGELVCEDRMIRPKPISDVTAYYNSSPMLQVMHSVAVAYRATVGKAFKWVGDILNSVAGPLFEAAYNAVPGVAREAVEDLINGLVNRFFGIVITGAETGSDLYEVIRGGAKTFYNDVSELTTGGTTLSASDIVAINKEIEMDNDLENSSFTSKLVNLDYDKSLVSRLLVIMPFNLNDAVGSTMTAAINPSTIFSGLRLSMSAKAQTEDPQGIEEMGWPTDPAIRKYLLLSPNDEFWDNCEDFNNEWSRQRAEDPDRKPEVRAVGGKFDGELVVGVNPCRLDHSAKESLNAPLTNEDDGGIGGTAEVAIDGDGGQAGESDGELATGDYKELAKEIVENNNIKKIGRNVQADLEAAARGERGPSGIAPKKILLQIIATMGRNYSFNITSLLRPGDIGSAHSQGEAVDIDGVNGDPAGPGSLEGRTKNNVKLIKEISPLLPKPSGWGQVGCGPEPDPSLPGGIDQFRDTCNHLHLEVNN